MKIAMGNKFLNVINNMPRPNPRKTSGFISNIEPSDDTEIKEVRWIGIPMTKNLRRMGEESELCKANLSEAILYTKL